MTSRRSAWSGSIAGERVCREGYAGQRCPRECTIRRRHWRRCPLISGGWVAITARNRRHAGGILHSQLSVARARAPLNGFTLHGGKLLVSYRVLNNFEPTPAQVREWGYDND